MKKRGLVAYVALFMFGILMTGCGGNSGSKSNKGAPEITSMKCEFVPDGKEAVIYGKNFNGAEVTFPGELPAVVNKEKSNETMLVVIVPEGASSGKINVKTAQGEAKSEFFFRDNRNTIINFDDRLATWGGYAPFDARGEKIMGIEENETTVTSLPALLPDPCSGNYGFLFGKYASPWSMPNKLYIQYVANEDEGGRGPISIAGTFEDYDLEDLVLKFEVYIPQEAAYKGVRTEILFGPFDSPDKHGRDVSPICFWEPYLKEGSFYTDGWETITIPLTQFTHGITSDEEVSKNPLNLKTATNFSFFQFGAPEDNPLIYLCLDNFRVVPASE